MAMVYWCVGILTVDVVVFLQSPGVFHSQDSFPSTFRLRLWQTSSGVVAACGGFYRIPCSCGDVYIGTTKRSVNTRIKEHERHCRLRDTERSAVAQHIVMNPDHRIGFDDAQLLCNTQHY